MKKNNESWILYSTCDEDSYSEIKVLDVEPSDDILCVTGSACRTLSLIAENPRSIISVDYSAGQNYLLELKMSAFENLDYNTLLGYFGVEDLSKSSRRSIHARLEKHISVNAQDYFKRNIWAIEKGVLFSGRHELFYIRFVAPLLKLIYGDKLLKLFNSSTLEEQRRIYKEEIRGVIWKLLIKKGFSETSFKMILNNPEYDIDIDVDNAGKYLLERIDYTFLNHRADTNHWASLMFNGKYLNRRALPHFLEEENYNKIRNAKTHLGIVTQNIIMYMDHVPNNSFDKFSLSDITSCINYNDFISLLNGVVRIGRQDSKLCYRNFLSKKVIPKELDSSLPKDISSIETLNNQDTSFAYTFEVANIAK